MSPKTLYEKIWDNHVVHEEPGTADSGDRRPALIYIDRTWCTKHFPAGVCRAEGRGTQSPTPRSHLRGDGPLGPDR